MIGKNPGHDEKSTRAGGRLRESGRGNDDEVASSAWIEKLGTDGLRETS
jgi:hypothetical protein